MNQRKGSVVKSKLYWLSLITTIGLFIVNTAGFVDTMTGSMLGCGRNWPLCNGSLFPEWDIHALIEFGHRFIVFIVTILMATFSFLAWRHYRSYKKIRLLIVTALFGLLGQSVLGAMAVLFINPPAVMATHMGVALIAFCSLLNITLIIRQLENPSSVPQVKANKTFARFTWFTIGYTFLAIYFGAYVARSGAGTSFQGLLYPTEEYSIVRQALIIDIAHRSIGVIMLLLIIGMVFLAKRIKLERPDLYVGSVWSVVLACLQALSGILLVYTHLSLGSILLHVTIISLLFGYLTVLGVQSVYLPKRIESDEEVGANAVRLAKGV